MQSIINATFEILNTPEFLEKVNKNRPTDQHRNSGYLCVINNSNKPENEIPLVLVAIGAIPDDKRQRWFTMAQEKAHILQHSQPTIKKGAIIADDYILSFSGLTEDGDELLMKLVAQACGLAEFSVSL